MNNLNIISGEASETESEGDDSTKDVNNTKRNINQGDVVIGEVSESDIDISVPTYSAVQREFSFTDDDKKKEHPCSLLHQKLREDNAKINSDIIKFNETLFKNVVKDLYTLDQEIIKSELTLQGAATSLKTLTTNSKLLKNKFDSLIARDCFKKD